MKIRIAFTVQDALSRFSTLWYMNICLADDLASH